MMDDIMVVHPSQQRLEKLVGVNRLISGTLNTPDLLSTILNTTCEFFEVEGCSLLTIEPGTGDLIFHTIEGGSEDLLQMRLKPDQGIVGWVVSNRESVLVNNVAEDKRFYSAIDQKGDFHTHSILCAPLELRGELYGALECINSSNPDGFREEDMHLLEAFASQAAVALKNARTLATVRLEKDAYLQELGTQFRNIIGKSESMKKVIDIAHRAARSKTTVLLRGESGTGKEVFARAIHNWSPRVDKPFIPVNSVALSPELLESDLFGHEKGSFTGATSQKKGKFEIAEGGTVFLDEIGDIGPSIQIKLLRVLQEREFQRVGGNQTLKADVRILAATNRNLEEALQKGDFREDLYYRLNVVNVKLPPLRERHEDIPDLVLFFVGKTCQDLGLPPLEVNPDAMDELVEFRWPGNVRQLANIIERAVVLARGEILLSEDFHLDATQPVKPGGEDPLENLPLSHAVDEFKVRMIRRALKLERGNQTRAAQRLGIRQPNLSRMMRTLSIRPDGE